MENKKSGLMAKFLIPSIIGIILFMIPVKYNGDWTVCVKILADIIGGALGGFLPILCVAIITVSQFYQLFLWRSQSSSRSIRF